MATPQRWGTETKIRFIKPDVAAVDARWELAGAANPEAQDIPALRTMKQPKKSQWQFGVCVDNAGYRAFLELHKIYRVLPDEDAAQDGDMRVIDESSQDYLYQAARFALIEVPKALECALLKAQ